MPGLEVSPFTAVPHDISKFDLTLSLQEEGNQIVGELEYATALFERSTIERYIGYFRRLLEAMVADDRQKVDRLPMLPEAGAAAACCRVERDGGGVSARHVHARVVRGAGGRGRPDAIAVVYRGASAELWGAERQANRLAHYLMRSGVKPDERVAICVERSLEMVVGLLAVLKAGGAMCRWIRRIRRSGCATCWRTVRPCSATDARTLLSKCIG